MAPNQVINFMTLATCIFCYSLRSDSSDYDGKPTVSNIDYMTVLILDIWNWLE